MTKVVKKVFTRIILLLLIVCVFFAGCFLGPRIKHMFRLLYNSHSSESFPNSTPYTADDVVDVETLEAFDETGTGSIEIAQQMVPYVVDVDFSPVLLKEAQLEKKLIIMTQKATASEIATKAGLFSLPVFKQTKAIIFHGEGTYFVDLSTMSSDDFVIDNDEKTIHIYISKPELSVKLLPDETEFFDSSNGTLRFGQMEITPEIMTTLESQGIQSITKTLESDSSTWETARKFAILSVKEIYEPLIVAQVDAAVQNAADNYAIPAYYTITVEIKN